MYVHFYFSLIDDVLQAQVLSVWMLDIFRSENTVLFQQAHLKFAFGLLLKTFILFSASSVGFVKDLIIFINNTTDRTVEIHQVVGN